MSKSYELIDGKVYVAPVPRKAKDGKQVPAVENAQLVVLGVNKVIRELADPAHLKAGDTPATPEQMLAQMQKAGDYKGEVPSIAGYTFKTAKKD